MPATINLFNRQPPRRTLFITLSFLTLCIFIIHFPILIQISTLRVLESIGGHHKPHHQQAAGEVSVTVTPEIQGQDGQSGMTSLGSPSTPHLELQPELPSSSQDTGDINNLKMNPSQHPMGTSSSGEEDMDLTKNHRHHKHLPPPPLNLICPLPPSLPPPRRLVIISDVHGHLLPLQKLLYSKLNFSPTAGDHAIFVGDLVTKGPDSKGVVALAMSIGASAVRGNHEDRVLAAAYGLKKLDYWPQQQEDEVDSTGKQERDRQREHQKDEHAKSVAKSLSKSQLKWLAARPVILRVGQLGRGQQQLSAEQQRHHKHHRKGKKNKSGEDEENGRPQQPWKSQNEVVVVHGGLVPGVELEKQDPWAVMNMRNLIYAPSYQGDKNGKEDEEEEVPVPVDSTADGEPWSKAWNRYQNHLPPSTTDEKEQPQKKTIVIYGHDARRGLQVDPQVDITPYFQKQKGSNKKGNRPEKEKGIRYAFGLDSGCGHGKRLTALVINLPTQEQQNEGAEEGEIKHEIVQVSCDDMRTGKDAE